MYPPIKTILSSIWALITISTLSAMPPHTRLNGIWAYGEEVTDSVNLDYKQNNLRFFCGTTESYPMDSVSYRFMLKGHDNDWITPFKEGWYFYTDLPPGDYEFMAQSRFNGGPWGEAVNHSFTITAPWWRSWWAYLLYAITISGTLLFIIYLIKTKIRIHNQLLVERENQRFRTDFVIHAGREFRTPLTVIRTTIEKLKGNSEYKLTRTDIQHLRNSSAMLMQMVEQLIDFKEIGHDFPGIGKGDILEMADIPINKDLLVMVVESDRQLADVIRRDLMRFMTAVVADGIDAAKKAVSMRPNAIIIDTELDGINAYDLVHQIKSNPATSQIPVILISDFDNSRSLLRAIRSEADDYLPKPFNCEVLTALVMKKIKAIREQSAKPAENIDAPKAPLFEKRADKLFLERLDKIIDSYIDDPDFDVNALSEQLSISRAQLYNKVKSLRGMTPVEYLRDVRLTKAATLLKKGNVSVKEVRAMVGMTDPTNFNRRFKEKFKICPTDCH